MTKDQITKLSEEIKVPERKIENLLFESHKIGKKADFMDLFPMHSAQAKKSARRD